MTTAVPLGRVAVASAASTPASTQRRSRSARRQPAERRIEQALRIDQRQHEGAGGEGEQHGGPVGHRPAGDLVGHDPHQDGGRRSDEERENDTGDVGPAREDIVEAPHQHRVEREEGHRALNLAAGAGVEVALGDAGRVAGDGDALVPPPVPHGEDVVQRVAGGHRRQGDGDGGDQPGRAVGEERDGQRPCQAGQRLAGRFQLPGGTGAPLGRGRRLVGGGDGAHHRVSMVRGTGNLVSRRPPTVRTGGRAGGGLPAALARFQLETPVGAPVRCSVAADGYPPGRRLSCRRSSREPASS